MKLDSKYFDCVRVKPDHAKVVGPEAPVCQWKGCGSAGLYRAPMGRGREGQYLRLCLEHVREFNASYNYFAGMSNAEVEAYQKDSLTGHRPTWRVGANSWAHGTQHGMGGDFCRRFADPHDLFAWRAGRGGGPPRGSPEPPGPTTLLALCLSPPAPRPGVQKRVQED